MDSARFDLGNFRATGCPGIGQRYADRVYVPQEVETYGLGLSEQSRCYDWALLRLAQPFTTNDPMSAVFHDFDAELSPRRCYSIGYPGDKPEGTVWWAGHGNRFLSAYMDGDNGGLLKVTVDSVSGHSGGPVYAFFNGTRHVVGVLVGAPVSECQLGQNWASYITQAAQDRINALILQNIEDGFVFREFPFHDIFVACP